MISHGLSSSGLFCFVNLVYERTGRRSLYLNKGVLAYLPIFSFLMFILCCSNISAPPRVNFFSEITIIGGLVYYDVILIVLFPLGSFLGVVFTLYLYSYSQHGKIYTGLAGVRCSSLLDYHTLIIHILPINLLGLKLGLFIV